MRPEDLRVAGSNLQPGRPEDPALPALVPARRHPARRRLRPDPARGSSSRSPAACCAGWSATSSSTRRPAKLGPAIAQLRAAGASGSTSTCSARPCSARRGDAPARGHPRAARPRRRRLRLDQGVVRRRASSRCGRSTRPSTGRRAADAAVRARRGIPDAQVHQPRHGGVPRPRPDDRGLHAHPRPAAAARASRPASCCRPTCPMRSARCRGSPSGRRARRAGGGAPIKVRLVKGANLAMERVDAAMHGWPLATYAHQAGRPTPTTSACSTGRSRPSTPTPCASASPGTTCSTSPTPGCSPSSAASQTGVEFEMLLGMATGPGRGRASRRSAACCCTRPVVRPAEFDVAISLPRPPARGERQPGELHVGRVRARRRPSAVRARDASASSPRSTDARRRRSPRSRTGVQDRARRRRARPRRRRDPRLRATSRTPTRRSAGQPRAGAAPHPRTAQRRTRTGSALERDPTPRRRSRDRRDALERSSIAAPTAAAGAALGRARRAPSAPRILHRAGDALAAHRGRLIEVMATETGKTIAEADVEVSEAVDFAHYYAERAPSSTPSRARRSCPSRLTVVTPPWNFPVAIPAGSVLVRARRRQRRHHQAGHAGAALRRGHGRGAVGGRRAARAARPRRPRREARARPAARLAPARRPGDPHRRVRDRRSCSAPGAPTCRCSPRPAARTRSSSRRAPTSTSRRPTSSRAPSATPARSARPRSLVILVGSVARVGALPPPAGRCRDARCASATRTTPTSQMGPIIEPAQGKLLHALTDARRRRGAGWSSRSSSTTPARSGRPASAPASQPGSEFHLTEFFGPVLGIMHAQRPSRRRSRLQNAVDYGLTAGLHSLDPDELAHWLDTVEAGNLYVNRGITGAIVQRQPFGGWKRSVGRRRRQGRRTELPVRARPAGARRRQSQPDDPAPARPRPAGAALLIEASPALDCDYRGVRSRAPRRLQRCHRLGQRVRRRAATSPARRRAQPVPLPAGAGHHPPLDGAPLAELAAGARRRRRSPGRRCRSAPRVPLPTGLGAAARRLAGSTSRSRAMPTWLRAGGRRRSSRPARIRLIGGDRIGALRRRSAATPTSRSTPPGHARPGGSSCCRSCASRRSRSRRTASATRTSSRSESSSARRRRRAEPGGVSSSGTSRMRPPPAPPAAFVVARATGRGAVRG